MKIKSLHIKNFKGFQELDLSLNGNSAVLFGINGVGKSSVLSAINYIFRVFLNQMNPAQSKAYERFQDEMVHVGSDRLEIDAEIRLKDIHFLSRFYKIAEKNTRSSELTYPKVNYAIFKEHFKSLYLTSEDTGMPVFVHYGTNRAVLDIPDRIRGKHHFDKLSAIERAIDQQLDFRTFFDWYRERETDEILKKRDSNDLTYIDPGLAFVRNAIEAMIGDVTGLRINRNPFRMVVDKCGKEIRIDMLSDGEKCTLALLGDLSRRLILANPHAENPLEGEGIVLIDEIELHMHPSWQRRILHILQEIFPNIQFIVTTHSPQVLGEVNDSFSIISLAVDENGDGYATGNIRRMDGFDSNMILEEYMNTSSESDTKKKLVHNINESIRKGQYQLAEELLERLRELAGEEDAEYILSRGYLQRRMMK